MRPVKKRLMELNPEKGEEERYQRAVVEIGEHISSSLLQWTHLEDRAQWKRYSLSPPPPPPHTHTHTHTHCGRNLWIFVSKFSCSGAHVMYRLYRKWRVDTSRKQVYMYNNYYTV